MKTLAAAPKNSLTKMRVKTISHRCQLRLSLKDRHTKRRSRSTYTHNRRTLNDSYSLSHILTNVVLSMTRTVRHTNSRTKKCAHTHTALVLKAHGGNTRIRQEERALAATLMEKPDVTKVAEKQRSGHLGAPNPKPVLLGS